MRRTPFAVPWADSIPTMTAGGGWGGSTAEPSRQGFAGDTFYGARAVARWTSVPYQNVYSTTDDTVFGVLAFHGDPQGKPGAWVKRVEMALDGGSWVTATWGLNPQTNTYEYRARIDASALSAGTHEVRAIVYPHSGYCRVLSGMYFRRWADGTTRPVAYVNPTTGNDGTGALNSTSNKYATIAAAGVALKNADATNKSDGCTIYLDAGDHKWYRAVNGTDVAGVSSYTDVRPSPGLTKADVNIVDPAGSGYDYTYITYCHLYDLTIKCRLGTGTPTTDYLWIDHCKIVGTGVSDTTFYVSSTDWTGTYVTDTTFYNCGQGPICCELARNVTTDTTGDDLFSATECVTHCTVIGSQEYGSNHTDLWQSRTDGTYQNIVIYRNQARQGALGQGFFFRENLSFLDFAFVENDWAFEGYPAQSQMIGTMTHFVMWNNTHLGTAWSFSFSDSALTEPLASANSLFSVRYNCFQWVWGSDPEGYLGHSITRTDIEAFGLWDHNHFINAWYDSTAGVPFGTVQQIGTNVTTGTSVTPGCGCTWSPIGPVHGVI